MASHTIYQFNIELDDYKPKMWRRFSVISDVTMAELGYVIMSLFEMEGRHLFKFQVPMLENFKILVGSYINSPENQEAVNIIQQNGGVVNIEFLYDDYTPKAGVLTLNALEITLSKVLNGPNEKLHFYYDFGDNWSFTLTLEEVYIDKTAPDNNLPNLLDGEGFGIIEDCGGVEGLTELARAFKEKSDGYEEYRDWLGVDDLNLEEFDKDKTAYKLMRYPALFKDAYESEDEQYIDNDEPDVSNIPPIDLWKRISVDVQKLLINSTFCSNCTVTAIVDYSITVNDDGDLALEGKCAKCGRDVTRIIDY